MKGKDAIAIIAVAILLTLTAVMIQVQDRGDQSDSLDDQFWSNNANSTSDVSPNMYIFGDPKGTVYAAKVQTTEHAVFDAYSAVGNAGSSMYAYITAEAQYEIELLLVYEDRGDSLGNYFLATKNGDHWEYTMPDYNVVLVPQVKKIQTGPFMITGAYFQKGSTDYYVKVEFSEAIYDGQMTLSLGDQVIKKVQIAPGSNYVKTSVGTSLESGQYTVEVQSGRYSATTSINWFNPFTITDAYFQQGSSNYYVKVEFSNVVNNGQMTLYFGDQVIKNVQIPPGSSYVKTTVGTTLEKGLYTAVVSSDKGTDTADILWPEPVYHDIVISQSVGGKISADKAKALPGEEVMLTISANDNYKLSAIYVNGRPISTGVMSFTMPDSDVVVQAVFDEIPAVFTEDIITSKDLDRIQTFFDCTDLEGGDVVFTIKSKDGLAIPKGTITIGYTYYEYDEYVRKVVTDTEVCDAITMDWEGKYGDDLISVRIEYADLTQSGEVFNISTKDIIAMWVIFDGVNGAHCESNRATPGQ